MKILTPAPPTVAMLACLAGLLAGGPAWGQVGYGGTGNNRPGGLGQPSGLSQPSAGDTDKPKGKEAKPEAPPPAIPGAEPDVDAAVVPADKAAADLSPNDALFDAITRGDLTAAKDALNRGAQLESHNVLGQTPTDAAIDLSRNDITFLLLSMRGAAPASRKPQVAKAGSPPPSGKAALHGRGRTGNVVQAKTRQPAPGADRGTPNPAVGFTGF